jgi:2,4-diketo-3-deoxy-L-fuconate hydrolase
MRICWFDQHKLGMVQGQTVYDVSAALEVLPPPRYPGPKGDTLVANLPRIREQVTKIASDAATHRVQDVNLLSPVMNPTKVIGVPVNYLKHVEEADANRKIFTTRYQGGIEEQGLFLKASSALVGCSEGVRVRFPSRRTDHEMELGVIIGKVASNISEDEALSYVAGYAIALDMVVRGPEDRSLRKSVDTYAVLGPWLVTADEIADPANLSFSLSVNGTVRQASNTSNMIMSIPRQITWASQFYTLWPGDIIMTGTCEGVGQVHPGDVIQCEIQDIGAMDVPVLRAS